MVVLDRIHISGYEFEFGIEVSLATVVVDGHPSPQVSFVFELVQGDRVVCLPAEPGCSVSHFTFGFSLFVTPYFPVECGSGKQAIGQGRKLDGGYSVVHVDAGISFQNVAGAITEEHPLDLLDFLA